MKIITLLSIILLLGWSSCSNTGAKEESADATKKSDISFSTLENNTHFGMSMADIKDNAEGDLVEEKSKHLTFSKDLKGKSFVDYNYFFDGRKLHKIEASYYMDSLQDAEKIHQKYSSKFDKKLKKRKGLWEGENGDVTYTVYEKLMASKTNPGVLVVWEKVK